MPTKITADVHPKAKKREVVLRDDGTLRIRVTAAAEEGKANQAVCELLAETLSVPKRDVTLVSGHRNRNKVPEVALERDDLVNRLSALRDLQENHTDELQPKHDD